MISRLSFFLCLMAAVCQAQPIAPMSAYLKKMDQSEDFKQASWGFSLQNIKTGATIISHQAEKSLLPASVLKTITTAAAIALLGDTFRFKTTLLQQGELSKEGRFTGTLIIKGHGNPVLGSPKGSLESTNAVIALFASRIKEAGIKSILGTIRADISYFKDDPTPAMWTWFDMGNYYAPAIGALNVGENQYEAWFKPGLQAGDSTTFLRTVPLIPELRLINHTTTAAGGGDQTYITGPPEGFEKHIYGKMPLGKEFRAKGAIPQPERYFVHLLREELKKQGVPITELPLGSEQKVRSTPLPIFIHYSAPLADICRYANYTSNNLVAECLLRTLGAEKGRIGSTAEGTEVVKKFIAFYVPNSNSLKMVDGSGLSRYNLLSPAQLTRFLSSISNQKWFPAFKNSLPYSGQNGTLETFCDGTRACNKVSAKSGTMDRVKCYAGYIKNKKGETNAFAVFVNHHHVPNREIVKWIEGLMELCVD